MYSHCSCTDLPPFSNLNAGLRWGFFSTVVKYFISWICSSHSLSTTDKEPLQENEKAASCWSPLHCWTHPHNTEMLLLQGKGKGWQGKAG